jgi:acyl-coenzyme A thioesterase PaaI-like protein
MRAIETPPGYQNCEMPDGGFAELIGPLFIRHAENGPRFAFRAETKHANARGVVHGGRLMTFADQALGLTIQRRLNTVDVATASLTCQMAASARPGDLIEGVATITRITGRMIFVKGIITCGDTVLMDASGIWVRINPSAPA